MKVVKFLMSLILAAVAASGIGVAFGATAGIVAMGASVIGLQGEGLRMAVTPEIWQNEIVGNLFKDNEFLLHSVDESQYVVGGSCVHIPQAGSPSGAKRNRTSLPATITKRTDTDITYALDEITTDPRFIPNAETVELSYDKRQSVLMEDQRYINELVANCMLYNWKPNFYIEATGTANADNLVYGTGSRTGVTYSDFVKAKTIFNKWNMPKTGRYVILDTEMYRELCDDVKKLSSDNLTAVYDPITGELKKLEGFTIFERSTVLMSSAVSTLTAVSGTKYMKFSGDNSLYTPEQYMEIEAGTTNAANTACVCGIFWSDIAVSRSVGDVKMFENTNDPQYYGDIYSFLVRCGGRAKRGDGKGVLGIVQNIGA
jgi:hypothetical protein